MRRRRMKDPWVDMFWHTVGMAVVVVLMIVLLAIITDGFLNRAHAHENATFKHMQDPIDNIIGQSDCADGSIVFWRDMDGDGEVDLCSAALLQHDWVHLAPAKMGLYTHYSGERKIGCTCQVIEYGN